MGQGFMLQVNNNSKTLNFNIAASTLYNFSQSTNFSQVQLMADTSTHEMYYEVKSGTATLWISFSLFSSQAVVGTPGTVELRFDSESTSEFPGMIYIANCQPLVLPQAPSPPGGTPPSANQVYPILILNSVQSNSNTWPFANLSLVQVVTPPLGPWG